MSQDNAEAVESRETVSLLLDIAVTEGTQRVSNMHMYVAPRSDLERHCDLSASRKKKSINRQPVEREDERKVNEQTS